MKLQIDDIIIEHLKYKPVRYSKDHIFITSPTTSELEDAIDSAFYNKVQRIIITGPLSPRLVTQYSEFRIEEDLEGELIEVDFKNGCRK